MADDAVDRGGVDPDARLADPVGRLVGAESAAGDDEVALVGQDGGEHLRDLGRVVLAVGVEGHDIGGAQGGGQLVADLEGHALAHVDR